MVHAILRLWIVVLALGAAGAGAAEGPRDDAFWYGTAADGSPTVRLHFFWSATCPHCQVAKPFVDSLPERYPWLELRSHEISGSQKAVDLYVAAARSDFDTRD